MIHLLISNENSFFFFNNKSTYAINKNLLAKYYKNLWSNLQRKITMDRVFRDKKISITVAKVPKIFPIANLLLIRKAQGAFDHMVLIKNEKGFRGKKSFSEADYLIHYKYELFFPQTFLIFI